MRIPEASAPPAVDVKANVAATQVLAATVTRSAAAAAAIVNETAATAPPITPDATYVEAVVSAFVVTMMIPTVGIPDIAKKPDRSVRVMMLLQVASAPPADGVNENVAAADVFAATRSDAAIANEGIGT